MLIRKLAAGVAMGALVLAAASVVQAQEITGGVAGQVTENGKPAAGATVVVTNVGTGITTTTSTGDDGFYTVRNLPPGGPYKVTITGVDKVTTTSSIDQVPIGAPYELDMALGQQVAEVVVTGTSNVRNSSIATGPRTTITAADIETLPSFSRDLHDLVRLNPFVTIDEANSNALIIAGTNNHFNTIYLDGVRQSDDFGLNNNGYPTQRSPFSLTIVQALNLEVAPYDVQYGNFTGGILNIVTKSGTNQFHGSVDYEFDSNYYSGKVIGYQARHLNPGPLDVDQHITTKFNDRDSSATIGGPIIPDKLFFFFGYDQFQGLGSATFVPSDVAGANQIAGVTQANVTALQAAISAAPYNYNALNYGGTAPVINTDYFAKVDWYITDTQHLWASYQSTKGTAYNTPDGSVSFKELNLASSDYLQAQNLTAYTIDLTSHWSSDLSTEAEYTYRDTESPTQIIGAPFANMLIEGPFTVGGATGGEIDLGPDISRQANNLGVIDQQAKIRGHYTLGDNVITAGYEWEQLAEFDLFVQDATGAYTFSTGCGPGDAVGGTDNVMTNVAAGVACKLIYQNASDNNPNSAAGTVINFTNTLYAEDEWHATPDLTLTGGLRFETYATPNKPLLNPRFVTQYGFANNNTINGENILLPRVGFNWRPDPSFTLTGGFGLFSGGNPGVYTYDSYDNPGNLLGTQTYSCSALNCGQLGPAGVQASAMTVSQPVGSRSDALINVTGSSIPIPIQQDITASANLGTGNANALAPGFKPPSTWKLSLSAVKLVDFNDYTNKLHGLGWLLGPNWRFHADVLATKVQDAVVWSDLWEEQNQLNTATAATVLGSATASPNGAAPDGRPLFNPNRYACIGGGALPLGVPAANCAGLNGTAGLTRSSGFDIELGDTNKGDSLIWALGVDKSWPWGLDIDYTYAHQNVRDVSAATSSVASSNYINLISADPNHPALATSDYQILYENRLSINFEHKFFGDNKTSFRLFLYDRAGLPFSYAFCPTASSTCASPTTSSVNFDELFGQYESSTMHQLLYVPKADSSGNVTLTSDPKVQYGSVGGVPFDINNFNTFLHTSGLIKYNGEISPRNAFRSFDVVSGDIQIAQELPVGFYGAKGEVYLDILNFMNLLNKNWGVDSEVGFPYVFAPVSALNCQLSGVTFHQGATAVTMPACAQGQGNYYQFQAFRPEVTSANANQFSTIQTLSNPPVETWVLKFGIRLKF